MRVPLAQPRQAGQVKANSSFGAVLCQSCSGKRGRLRAYFDAGHYQDGTISHYDLSTVVDFASTTAVDVY